MEMILLCFPFISSLLPCSLAWYWKGRDGFPWLLLSAIPAYPLTQYNMDRLAESIGGNPLGGSNCFMPYSFLQLVFSPSQIFAILFLRGMSSVKSGML